MPVAFDVEVLPIGALGAEVRNIDLAQVTGMEIDAIKAAWYRHDMLLFRNQKLTDDALLSFSKHFGALDSPPNQGAGRKSPLGFPEIYVVSNVLDGQGEPIGRVGETGNATGPHLHFDIRLGGVNGQHTDPYPTLRNAGC